jgi:hypothetical protein
MEHLFHPKINPFRFVDKPRGKTALQLSQIIDEFLTGHANLPHFSRCLNSILSRTNIYKKAWYLVNIFPKWKTFDSRPMLTLITRVASVVATLNCPD